MPNNRILVTGANGFVGCQLSKLLEQKKYFVSRIIRSFPTDTDNKSNMHGKKPVHEININKNTDWSIMSPAYLAEFSSDYYNKL